MRSNISDLIDSKKLKPNKKERNNINKHKRTSTCKKQFNIEKKISAEPINYDTQIKKLEAHLCLTQNIKFNYNSKKIEKTKINKIKTFDKSPIETLKLNKNNAVKKILSPKADIYTYNTITSKKNIYKIDSIPKEQNYGKKINFNDDYHIFSENSKKLSKSKKNKVFSSNDIRESIKKERIIDISVSEDESLIINNYEENENEDNNIINTTFPKLSSNPFLTVDNAHQKQGRCIQQTQLYYNKVKSPSKTKTIVSINSSTTQNSNDTINNLNVYNLDTSKRKRINDLNSNIYVEGEIDNDKNNNINSQIQNNNEENNNYYLLFNNLLIAVKNGNEDKFFEIIQKIQRLPKNVINFNEQEKDSGNTILHYASKGNNINIVKTLFRYNCDPNIRNNDNQTPLHLASINDNIDICKILIENGALFDIYDSYKNTPIHYACINKHKELANYFYEIFIETDTDEKICDNLTNNKDIHSLFQKYLLSPHQNKKEALNNNNSNNLASLQNEEKNKGTTLNKSKLNKKESINKTKSDSYSKICLNSMNIGLNDNNDSNNILINKNESNKNDLKKTKKPKKSTLVLKDIKERNTKKKKSIKVFI